MTVTNDTATNTNDDGAGGDEKPQAPMDLDALHESIAHDESFIKPEENNDASAGDEEEDETNDDAKKAPDDSSDDEKNNNKASDDEDTNFFGDEEDQSSTKTGSKPEENNDEVNTDITENVVGKIAVKNIEGETFYFNNLNEVPDDFEPISAVAWSKADKQFKDKEIIDAKHAQDRAEAESNQKAIQDLANRWKQEAEVLDKLGELPKDKAEREKVVAKVFSHMRKVGQEEKRVVESFTEAFKEIKDAEAKAKEEKEKKEAADLKKKKGSSVAGSNSGASTGRINKMQGVPAGVSLDAVHESIMGTL